MSGKLYLGFLWHMHQPYYRDPVSDLYMLPWVRLHAVNAYYTVPKIASRFENIRMTFNLVPSLLEQIQDYVDGAAVDLYEHYSRMDPDGMSAAEKGFVLRYFFQANLDTMINPYQRFHDLMRKRGMDTSARGIDNAVSGFNRQDIIDLQTLFNLCWIGPSAKAEDHGILRIESKGRMFSIDERDYVLDYHHTVLANVVGLYRQLMDDGLAELSTSPFYHPILPLLCDSAVASQAHPGVPLPRRFEHPDDASEQIFSGIEEFERVFGRPPTGMWPSEGSVSREALGRIRGAGLKWAASDEQVLFNSIGEKKKNRDSLFKPWLLDTESGEIALFFRDRKLSDKIGFSYSNMKTEDAVGNFIAELKDIADDSDSSDEPRFVSVILDGENPWEYFPNGGQDFITSLLEAISAEDWIETRTFTKHLEEHPPASKLEKLVPGSWINANFDIWIGKDEANKAWEYLGDVRSEVTEHLAEVDDPVLKENILKSIYRAEGSDWFWWYDDDFTSDTEMVFDNLFRNHLIWVYIMLGHPVPSFLDEPVKPGDDAVPARAPTGLISPIIDGEISDFFEWANAGEFKVKESGGAMYSSRRYIKKICFGSDGKQLFLRFDPVLTDTESGDSVPAEIKFYFLDSDHEISVPWPSEPGACEEFKVGKRNGTDGEKTPERFRSICLGRILELSIPFDALELSYGEKVKLVCEVRANGRVMKRIPQKGYIEFEVPDESFDLFSWSV